MLNPDSSDDYQSRPINNELHHIPGDKGLPIIGITHKLFTNFHPTLQDIYENYGPVSSAGMILHKEVLCLGPEVNRQIFLDPDKNFSAMMGYDSALGQFYQGGLLLRDFDDHRAHRRLFQTAFKSDSLQTYIKDINQLASITIPQWINQSDFRFYPNIKALLLDIAIRLFLGIENIEGTQAKQLSSAFSDITAGLLGVIRIDHPLFSMARWRRGMQAKRFLEDLLISSIEERRNSSKTDIFSVLTRETDEAGNYFSDRDIASHINFLLFAAHDTVTSNLCYMVQYLAQYEEFQSSAYQQSRDIKDQLEYSDLSSLSILESAHLESLRLTPSAALLHRRTINDCEIEGIHIPRDTILTLAPQFTHTMSELWNNPTEFDPLRFEAPRLEHKQHPFQFIPFGGGAHKCIGMHFANMLVKVILHHILLQYRWTLPTNYQPTHQVIPLPKQKDNLPIFLERRR